MDKVFVFGHKNPDTDSVCGAIALSYLKNKLGMNTEPRILSPISKETEFVLNKFKLKVPTYLNDVKIQLKDVNFHKNYVINENKTILAAYNLLNKNGITGIPLVDDDKKFKGYISLKEIASNMILNENLEVNTSFDNLVDTLDATEYIKFDDVIDGYAHAATFDDETFLNSSRMDEKTILIVGDRRYLIEEAIKRHVKMIILVKNTTLTNKELKLANENQINIIITPKSSFKIARVLCLSNPIKSIKRGEEAITFNSLDYLSDFEEATTKLKHTNYPIVNNKNVCVGMLRTMDAHEYNRKKVILVDHNMKDQSVDGLDEAEILEIVDHHNLGDINTSLPVNFRCMKVGSVCTVIYFMYKENNIKIPYQIAGCMLSGIISDTLLLKSPTTTETDTLIAKELAKIAKVDVKKYGLQLLESGVSIDGMDASDIIYKDYKIYKVGDHSISMSQVFTTDYNQFKPIQDSLIEELNQISLNNHHKVSILFVTNFLTNNSYILYNDNAKNIIELAYGIENLEQGMMFKNFVSRKKQMVPNVIDVIEHM